MRLSVSWNDSNFLEQKDNIDKIVSYIGEGYFSGHEVHIIRRFSKVNIILVDSKKIRELNSMYRDKDKSTDILSFDIRTGSVLGELYICLEEVIANADYFKSGVNDEILMVLIHGILHLCGHDHSAEMFALQDKIIHNIQHDNKDYFRVGKSGKKIRKNET